MEGFVDRLLSGCHSLPLATSVRLSMNSPISIRKFLIAVCQTGVIPSYNECWSAVVATTCFIPDQDRTPLSPQYLHDVCVTLVSSHFIRSFVWMVCRCCPEPSYNDQSEEIRRQTFAKEFSAAVMSIRDHPTAFETFYFDFIPTPMGTSVHHTQEWYRFAQDVVHKFSYCRLFNGQRTIYPKVNRKKNIARTSARDYLYATNSTLSISEVTTSCLESYYEKTGMTITGPCEIRSAWKFNDLKPRYYYCQGGSAYFASRYIKELAVAMMDSIPACETRRRKDPSSYVFLEDDEDLVFWDYSNFTSSLSDLKYFLYYVISGCRHIRPDAEMLVFDSYQGQISISPWDLLDEYNLSVNDQSDFSILRVIDSGVLENYGDIDNFSMANNGPLGVAGNIGFSTSNHGSCATAVAEDPDKTVCVGDDALTATRYLTSVIQMMSELAPIAPEKFGVVLASERYTFKFLKRGVSIENGEMQFDILYDLPLLPIITGTVGNRTVYDFSMASRLKSVVTQVSDVLWYIGGHKGNRVPFCSDNDLDLIAIYFNHAYNYLGLPKDGALPGYYHKRSDTSLYVAIPPLPQMLRFSHRNYDPRLTDWAEHLFDTHLNEWFNVPAEMPYGDYATKPRAGTTVSMPFSKFWTFMEDFGLRDLKG